jgi:hypothetical protein
MIILILITHISANGKPPQRFLTLIYQNSGKFLWRYWSFPGRRKPGTKNKDQEPFISEALLGHVKGQAQNW